MALYESSASISSRVHIVYGKNGLFKFEKNNHHPPGHFLEPILLLSMQ